MRGIKHNAHFIFISLVKVQLWENDMYLNIMLLMTLFIALPKMIGKFLFVIKHLPYLF